MSIFKKSDRGFKLEMDKQAEKQKEIIHRKEFCMAQAALVCDEMPTEVIRVAEKMYEWIYGEQA